MPRPPHYRGGTPAQHCGNCGAYRRLATHRDKGWCRMYQLQVAHTMTCDKWYAK